MGGFPSVAVPRLEEALSIALRHPERTGRLFSIGERVASADTEEELLKRFVHAARSAACADGATLTLRDPEDRRRRPLWAGRDAGPGATALERELRVAERPYATLRLTTGRRRFSQLDEALVDLLCFRTAVAIEREALKERDAMLERVRGLLGEQEDDAGPAANGTVREIGDLHIDLARYQVSVAGSPVHLTPSEFRLLELLTERPGHAYDRREIVRRLWDSDYVGNSRVVDAHVARLRRKIERDRRHPRRLQHVRGVGYRYVPVGD